MTTHTTTKPPTDRDLLRLEVEWSDALLNAPNDQRADLDRAYAARWEALLDAINAGKRAKAARKAKGRAT